MSKFSKILVLVFVLAALIVMHPLIRGYSGCASRALVDFCSWDIMGLFLYFTLGIFIIIQIFDALRSKK